MKENRRPADKANAQESRQTVDGARQRSEAGAQQGVTNRSVAEERREQEKLPPRDDGRADDATISDDAAISSQSSAGKTGLRSDTRKHVSANRGGIASGKTRAKAGAYGMADRNPADTVRAKRGTTRAATVRDRGNAKAARSPSRGRAA
jgi:hypothetical protein